MRCGHYCPLNRTRPPSRGVNRTMKMSATIRKHREFKVVGQRPVRPDGVDKVTGRALYGADATAPGMLVGAVLRSPHPHARIVSLDTGAARALPGVKAVITAADFAAGGGRRRSRRLAQLHGPRSALYDGHPWLPSPRSMRHRAQALERISVRYEVLPHVIDVDRSHATGGTGLHPGVRMRRCPTAFAQRHQLLPVRPRDVDAGLAVRRRGHPSLQHRRRTPGLHRTARLPGVSAARRRCRTLVLRPRGLSWCASTARISWAWRKPDRVTPSEIGGGFGGKTTVFIEPVALALSRKAGRPVKLVMSRTRCFAPPAPPCPPARTSPSA